MATVKPFKAIRPTADLVDKVAALPYDVMNSEEARQMVKGNSYSFLHVDKAEIDLDASIHVYDQKVYEKAKENLNRMREEGIYIQDEQECLYIYRLTMDGNEQIGLVGCTSIDEYQNNTIKKHEHTRADKEQDRIQHVDYCDANTGPIFLTYRAKTEINTIINKWIQAHAPIYDFAAEDQVGHTVWVIDDKEAITKLTERFREVRDLYIADGHHRAASAVKVGLKRREQNPEYTGEEEFNFFLSVIFPDNQLQIMDYNRVVKDLNRLTEKELFTLLNEKFTVEACTEQKPYKPIEKHTFGMYLHNQWYKLTPKPGTYNGQDPVENLDVSILQTNLLSPILGIDDPRTDKRIDFIGGIRGLEELEKRVSQDMTIAFSMYPTTIEDLMNIADADKIMPPKSTWFEPKLRSGIFIHSLQEK